MIIVASLVMLYINIQGKKEYLDRGIIEKYKLKPGMLTPFTRHKILEDDKVEIVPEEQEGGVV